MTPSGIEPATFQLVAQCSATSTIIKQSIRKHTKQELYIFHQWTYRREYRLVVTAVGHLPDRPNDDRVTPSDTELSQNHASFSIEDENWLKSGDL